MRTTPPPSPRATLRAVSLLALATLVAGCTASTPPLVPTALLLSLQAVSLDAVGATQSVTVTVNDQKGNPMTGQVVTWTSSAPAVATVSGSSPAVVNAVANGSATLTAKAGSAQATVVVNVQQVPVAPVKAAGDGQTGPVGAALATQVRVVIQDRLGNAMPGIGVAFAVGAGSGSVTPANVNTQADGTAAATWTLGVALGAQSLTATATGATSAASFAATAVAGPPAALALIAGGGQSATVGTAVATPPQVRVSDSFGNPVAGAAVTFSAATSGGSVTGASALTNASGVAIVGSWTLGTVAGTQTLTATVAGVPALSITAAATAGPATTVIASAGNNQSAAISTQVAVAPAVRVTDAFGNNVGGAAVNFAVATGGGTATGTAALTTSSGVATVGSWTLGATVGANTMTATVAGTGISGNPVTFTATGTAGGGGGGGGGGGTSLNIELRFLTSGTTTQIAAFTAAATRWMAIIQNKLADVPVVLPAGSCGSNSPAMNETVDDLVIFVTLEPIDGPGNVLGAAGPCIYRTASGTPIVGRMRFDVADLASLEASGQLQSTILHEMGHVLGIGTLWTLSNFNLLANPSLPSSPGVDTHYVGANGIAGFDAIGGTTYTGGAKVPVENLQGGSGTRDGHWRESVLQNELMTGFLNSGNNPLSLLTLRSLQDMGYTVNTAQADAFFLTLTAAVRSKPETVIELKDDIIRDPIGEVDERGRIIRWIKVPW